MTISKLHRQLQGEAAPGDILFSCMSYYRVTAAESPELLRVQGLLTPTETGATLTCIDHETELTHAEAWQEFAQYPHAQAVLDEGAIKWLLIIK